MDVLQTENLTKRFGRLTAVDRLSLHVKQGEIYGFLGLNGAGKTTMIRLLLGMIRPDEGGCELFGKEPRHMHRLWNEVGYLIETPHAYPDLSVYENLRVIQKLRGVPDPSGLDAIIERLQLGRYRNVQEKHLSLGNKQRLGLAKALMHQPKLLILDEPVNGLDPAGIVEVRHLLQDLALNHGTTIFLSSHILSEIARLTTRIGIIHQGALIRELHADDLRDQLIRKLHIRCQDNSGAAALLSAKGYPAEIRDAHIVLDAPGAIENPEALSALLVKEGFPPAMISVIEEDLEQYFLRLINNEPV